MDDKAVIFLCPSLEPGRSGVGDYARRLAAGVEKLGLAVTIASLNEAKLPRGDYAITEPPAQLRLVDAESWRNRMARLEAMVVRSPPALVSLQFVSYGYHHKGLPFGLAQHLRRVFAPSRFEIMFHEIWCGGHGANLKDRLYGVLQKQIIHRMIAMLKPRVIHTQATPYLEALRREGMRVTQMPLVSNIPVLNPWGRETFLAWLNCRTGLLDAAPRTIFCMFGSLYPQWDPNSLLPILRERLTHGRRKGLVLSMGHRGAVGDSIWKRMELQGDDLLRYVELGPLPEDEISQCLHASHYGVSTTPPDLIEKSGAAAAMFEHGLPVLASRPPVYGEAMAHRVGKAVPLLVYGDDLRRFELISKHLPDSGSLARVARQFVSDIGLSNGPSYTQ